MKLIVLIGSMQWHNRYLMERARHNFTEPGAHVIAPCDEVCTSDLVSTPPGRSPSNPLVNEEKSHWRCVVDRADEVVVVCKPDGSLGAGTVDELRNAMGSGKTILWD